MKKILLLLPSISDYRVCVYNIIAEKYDFTVGYVDRDSTKSECLFKKVLLPSKKIGCFFISYFSLFNFCMGFDAVIFAPDIHCPLFCFLPFIKRKYPVIPWSIGTRASYKRNYDLNRRKGIRDFIMYLILKKSDAIIFYMDQAIDYWKNFNLDREKIFIAHNTTNVERIPYDNKSRSHLLFVGSLYKEKGVITLLEQYVEAFSILKEKMPLLDIVGGGDEYEHIKQFIVKNGIESHVILHGPIYEENILASLFSLSIVCISPNQAGLTVLKSMGYGVPFITRKDSITGGEIFNISNGQNGVLYASDSDLKEILFDIEKNNQRYINMGVAAKNYYNKYATPAIMAEGVISSLRYVLYK